MKLRPSLPHTFVVLCVAAGTAWAQHVGDDAGAVLPPGVYVLESGPGVRAKVVKLK